MNNSIPHVPILRNEMCEHLLNKKDGIYLDGTVGFGGHSNKILKYINKNGYLIGLDLDPYALEYSNKRLSVHLDSFSLHHANYKEFPEIINSLGIKKLDGMLFDLGTSSYQVDSEHRGFSYMKESNLDMRFNTEAGVTANEFLNSVDEADLANIIYLNSGEKKSRRVAKSILKSVRKGEMLTTLDLRNSIEKAVGQKYLIKSLSRVFQAIRIHINNELQSLKELLNIICDYIKTDGKIVFITFHSIEDRLIKSFFKHNALTCICPIELPLCQCKHQPRLEIVTKKAIEPSVLEVSQNNRARSAKMRVARGL